MKCKDCRGFGYTKGSEHGPWDKKDCETCNASGQVLEDRVWAAGTVIRSAIAKLADGTAWVCTETMERWEQYPENVAEGLESFCSNVLMMKEMEGPTRDAFLSSLREGWDPWAEVHADKIPTHIGYSDDPKS